MKLRLPMQSRRDRRRLPRRGDAKRCEYRIELRNIARHQARLDLRWTRHRIDAQASRNLDLRCWRVHIQCAHHYGTGPVYVIGTGHSRHRNLIRTGVRRRREGDVDRTRETVEAALPVDIGRARGRRIEAQPPETPRSNHIEE